MLLAKRSEGVPDLFDAELRCTLRLPEPAFKDLACFCRHTVCFRECLTPLSDIATTVKIA